VAAGTAFGEHDFAAVDGGGRWRVGAGARCVLQIVGIGADEEEVAIEGVCISVACQ
jgi:hypothetical protein